MLDVTLGRHFGHLHCSVLRGQLSKVGIDKRIKFGYTSLALVLVQIFLRKSMDNEENE